MWHVLKTGKVRIGFRLRYLGKETLRRPRQRREDNIKIYKKCVREAGTGLIWLRVGTGGGILPMR
jgi:hypothetical protein